MGAPDEPEEGAQEEPQQNDDTLEWLNALIGAGSDSGEKEDSGANEKIPRAESIKDEDIVDWLDADLHEELPGEQVLPDWLVTELSREEPAVIDKSEVEMGGDPEATIVAPRSAVVPEQEETTGEELEPAEDESGGLYDEASDLSWLEQIAIGEGAAIDEPPTMSWDDVDKDQPVQPEEEVGGILSWLAESAAERDPYEQAEIPSAETLEPAVEQPSVPEYVEDMTIDLSAELPEDPDDAMAWLEHLAARQGTPLEELPTMASQAQFESEDKEIVDKVTEDEWELEESGRSFESETIIGRMSPESSDIPDDPDEAMAWLERLAARQGAPIEELPSIDQELEALVEPVEGEPSLSEEFEEVLAEIPEVEVTEELEVQVEMVEPESEPVEEYEGMLARLSEYEKLEEVELLAEMVEPESEAGEEFEEVLAETPEVELLEELEVSAEMAEPESEPGEEYEGMLARLSELEEIEEVELPDEMVEPESEPVEEFVGILAELSEYEEVEEVELPAETVEPESEPVEEFEGMLAELSEYEEVEEAKLPAEMVEPEFEPGEEFEEVLAELSEYEEVEEAELPAEMVEPVVDEELQAVMAELSDIELPENDEEALSWLWDLAVTTKPESTLEPDLSIKEVVQEPKTPAMPHDIVEARAEAETMRAQQELLASDQAMKEDVLEEEDALAWLEQLADTKSEAATAFVEREPKEETVKPDWIEAIGDVEGEPDEGLGSEELLEKLFELPVDEEVAEEPYTSPFDIEEFKVPSVGFTEEEKLEEPSQEALSLEELEETFELLFKEEALEKSLLGEEIAAVSEPEVEVVGEAEPELVAEHPIEELEDDDLEWLDTLGEMDVTGWLVSEEAAGSEQDVEVEPIFEAPLEEGWIETPAPTRMEVDILSPMEIPDEVDHERLEFARSAAEVGDLKNAVSEYAELIKERKGLPFLIADLETWIEKHDDEPLLKRALGDAYAQNGQLHMALSAYRQALNQL